VIGRIEAARIIWQGTRDAIGRMHRSWDKNGSRYEQEADEIDEQ
jgi:hypothetical protein